MYLASVFQRNAYRSRDKRKKRKKKRNDVHPDFHGSCTPSRQCPLISVALSYGLFFIFLFFLFFFTFSLFPLFTSRSSKVAPLNGPRHIASTVSRRCRRRSFEWGIETRGIRMPPTTWTARILARTERKLG